MIQIDDNGNETIVEKFINFEDAIKKYDAICISDPSVNYAVKSQDTYWKVKYATVKFKKIQETGNSGSYIRNIDYIEDGTNIKGYLNPVYGIDAVYLETKEDKVKFRIAGVTGWVDASLVEIVPYSDNTTFVSYYKLIDGKIKHAIKSTDVSNVNNYNANSVVGFATDYLKENVVYYSYDGHYFYTNYFEMTDDYRNNTSNHAVNKDKPFYNYYQFLPFHSKSNYSGKDLNKFISSKYSEKPKSTNTSDLKPHQSLLFDEGDSFAKIQEIGVNPVMTMGIAINESGWGRSKIALSKNNLFGLSAYDSDTDQADRFESPAKCIESFAKQWVTWGYLDTDDFRYYGGHLGDKASGMNVKYASDPYWGEKAASHSYTIDAFLEKKDYQKYALGIKESADNLIVRKSSSTDSAEIMKLKNKDYSVRQMPVIILGNTTGSKVNGNDIWYQIYTDHVLDEHQNKILFDNKNIIASINIPYNFDYSKGYVSSEYITVVNKEKGMNE